MVCPECGVETKGWNHNNRGLKCTNCMAPLPEEEAPEVEAKEEKPEDEPKPAPKKKQSAAKK